MDAMTVAGGMLGISSVGSALGATYEGRRASNAVKASATLLASPEHVPASRLETALRLVSNPRYVRTEALAGAFHGAVAPAALGGTVLALLALRGSD